MINNLDDILKNVEKPVRYTGGEWNSILKNKQEADIRFAFCFPDIYEIGMSNLGMKIIYNVINQIPEFWCERAFMPWTDMEEQMRQNGIPLYGLESRDPLREFDFIGFSLQYELSYTCILNMLDLAGLPVLAKDRREDMPVVCAGGPCACNPEPVADFIDLFVIGDGEEVIIEVLNLYNKMRKKGGRSKREFLKEAAKIEGVYVPSLYEAGYNEDGTIAFFKPLSENGDENGDEKGNEIPGKIPEKIRKRVVKELDSADFPEKMIVPFTEIVHDRVTLEIFRGCMRGCRFCQAGFIYRPVRRRSKEELLDKAVKLIKNTGYDEISLLSLSSCDYPELGGLADMLMEKLEDKKVNLALPSLRVDSFTLELLEKVSKVRKSSLTFAPEAGTQRLRDVINKGIGESDLYNAAALAFNGGYNRIKLYFMLGLPTETDEDVNGIAGLTGKVVDEYYKVPKGQRQKGLSVTVSTSTFVPKPFTPFQWEAQDDLNTIEEKQKSIKRNISKKATYNYHESKLSLLEAVISRGDRKIGKLLLKAFEAGCKLDSWQDKFVFEKWVDAAAQAGVDFNFYANRKRDFDEILPWDHIDMGINKEYLIDECKKAYEGKTTPNCMEKCGNCGIISYKGGVCIEKYKN